MIGGEEEAMPDPGGFDGAMVLPCSTSGREVLVQRRDVASVHEDGTGGCVVTLIFGDLIRSSRSYAEVTAEMGAPPAKPPAYRRGRRIE